MKKVVITLALLLTAGTMFAQEVEKGSKQRWRSFETNRFIDNWEISVGAGAQTYYILPNEKDGVKYNPEGFGKDFTLAIDASLTKWVSPIIGLRFGYIGPNFTHYRGTNALGESTKLENNYWLGHADLMINLTNWICHYKADRTYNAILFAGMGFGGAKLNGTNGWNKEFMFPVGLLQRFRLCDAWYFNVELRDVLVKPGFDNAPASLNKYDWAVGNMLSATAGFTYRLPSKRSFNAYTPIDKSMYDTRISTLENDLQSESDKIAEYQKQIDRYKKQLSDKERELQEALKNASKGNPAVQVSDDVTLSIFFPIGSAEISDKNEINIKYMADVIKASNKTFTITGYADANSGSENRNMELSQQRAEAVYNALANAGVDKSKIKVDYKGCSVQPFEKDYLNRVAIIK